MGISVVHLNGKSIQHSFFFFSQKNDFSVCFTNRLRADDTHVWPRQLSRHTDDLKKVTATYKHSHPQYSTHVIPWPFPPRSTTNPAPCLCSSGKQQTPRALLQVQAEEKWKEIKPSVRGEGI